MVNFVMWWKTEGWTWLRFKTSPSECDHSGAHSTTGIWYRKWSWSDYHCLISLTVLWKLKDEHINWIISVCIVIINCALQCNSRMIVYTFAYKWQWKTISLFYVKHVKIAEKISNQYYREQEFLKDIKLSLI